MPINLLNLQDHLREANSTAAQNTLEVIDPPKSYEAMAAPLSPPRLLPSGDSAITVEFSRNIDDAANQRVLALDRSLARETIALIPSCDFYRRYVNHSRHYFVLYSYYSTHRLRSSPARSSLPCIFLDRRSTCS